MEISRSLKESAVEAIADVVGIPEASENLIPVEGTPFFLSLTGEGILPHGTIEHEGRTYYIGTLVQLS